MLEIWWGFEHSIYFWSLLHFQEHRLNWSISLNSSDFILQGLSFLWWLGKISKPVFIHFIQYYRAPLWMYTYTPYTIPCHRSADRLHLSLLTPASPKYMERCLERDRIIRKNPFQFAHSVRDTVHRTIAQENTRAPGSFYRRIYVLLRFFWILTPGFFFSESQLLFCLILLLSTYILEHKQKKWCLLSSTGKGLEIKIVSFARLSSIAKQVSYWVQNPF